MAMKLLNWGVVGRIGVQEWENAKVYRDSANPLTLTLCLVCAGQSPEELPHWRHDGLLVRSPVLRIVRGDARVRVHAKLILAGRTGHHAGHHELFLQLRRGSHEAATVWKYLLVHSQYGRTCPLDAHRVYLWVVEFLDFQYDLCLSLADEGIYNTYVIDTDYKTWALIMHCAEKAKSPKYLSALLLARTPKLPINAINFLR